MKEIFSCTLIFVLSIGIGLAQDEGFYLDLKSDTILAGNVLQISFVANNVAGKFKGPDLNELNIISGPNTSTSMSMVNGEVTQFASYKYGVYLGEAGDIIIPPAYLETNDETLETDPRRVVILPNPEGIIEQYPSSSQPGMFHFEFPQMQRQKKESGKSAGSKKKKRKLKKI